MSSDSEKDQVNADEKLNVKVDNDNGDLEPSIERLSVELVQDEARRLSHDEDDETKEVAASSSSSPESKRSASQAGKVTKKKKKKRPPSFDEIVLVALINKRSGGGKGLVAFESFRRIPNCDVIDILQWAVKDTSEPDAYLADLIDNQPHCRLIVGGGDGTVTWAFQILDRIGKRAPVAILPLGTANEVSGCIGWSNADNGRNLEKFAKKVRRGELIDLDLWKVDYDDDNSGEDAIELPPRRPTMMVAFLSFGLDARIAHRFHEHREKLDKQTSVLGSKMIYFKYGMSEINSPSPKLNPLMQIETDGKPITQPNRSYRCLQIMNVNSMADGVDFFGTGKSNSEDVLQEGDYRPPKLNDGILEIVGTKTVHHMNFIRANISHSLRLSQGSDIKITLLKPIPMEVDGEAFLNPRGVVHVSSMGKREVILGPSKSSSTRRGVIRKNASDQSVMLSL